MGLMVMGGIVIAFGALASFMHIRQQDQDAKRKMAQVRRLAPLRRRAPTR